MSRCYKDEQCHYHEALIKENPNLFNNDEGGMIFYGHPRGYVLNDGRNNLYKPICEDVIAYFNDNRISWWNGQMPTGNTLSSQIACLNHLFAIRGDKGALLDMLNGVKCGVKFQDLLAIECDSDPQYISFEVVSKVDHLNETKSRGKLTRGANCTSVDALIYAVDATGKRWLIPIEWKYTEHYNKDDKSNEDRAKEPKGSNGRGETRLNRYTSLIDASEQLKTLKEYRGSIYFQEPFYQLMRQTLWVENMVKHQATEQIVADDYLHLHVVPSANRTLLDRRYNIPNKEGIAADCKGMEETWKSMLAHPDKYIVIDPEQLFTPIIDRYKVLSDYLRVRYWHK